MDRQAVIPHDSDRRSSAPVSSIWLSDTALLIYIALATLILHLIIGNRYGIHRDELAFTARDSEPIESIAGEQAS